MYVLRLAPMSRGKQAEVSFDLVNADDAIALFVAKILDGKSARSCLYVSVQHKNGEKLASQLPIFCLRQTSVTWHKASRLFATRLAEHRQKCNFLMPVKQAVL